MPKKAHVPKKNGRPTKLTPTVMAKLKEAFSLGLTDDQAASVVNVSDVTLTMWKRNPSFLAEIQGAINERLMLRLRRIEAGDNGWQGCGWLLERLLPRQWAKPEVMLAVNNITNQTTNNTLIVSAEIADGIESRMRSAHAKVAELFANRRNGAKATPEAIEPIEVSLEPVEIAMPQGEPGASWWSQLVTGSGERPVERSTAIKVCRLIAEDVLGKQRARSAPISFAEDGPVLLRDVQAMIQDLCGADGWSALRRRAE